jgi:hypothetical protein
MSRIVKCGHIQASNALAEGSVAEIKQAMVDKHVGLVEEAGKQGVQILCLQEIFHGPYFCAEQDTKWYASAETVPGPLTEQFGALAKQYKMVIYPSCLRKDSGWCLLQHRGRYRCRRFLSGQIPEDSYSPHLAGFLGEVLFQTRQPGVPGLPDSLCKNRDLHLLRPPLSGVRPSSVPQRGRDPFQPFSYRHGQVEVPLGTGTSPLKRWLTACSSGPTTGLVWKNPGSSESFTAVAILWILGGKFL